MKVNVSSVCEVKATKVIPSGELAKLVRPIAGKKVTVDVSETMAFADFVAAARTALGISDSEVFADIQVKRGGMALNKAKNLAENTVRDGTSLVVQFKYVV